MNADGWHKVCDYLPHLQAIRLAEKRMSAVEIVVPPQTAEMSVDATVLSVDTGVQAVVEMRECSVQFSPVLVDQVVSAIPGVHEVSIDARPSFAEVGILAIPTFLEKSVGATVVGRAVGSLTNVASKSLEAIIETVAPKETPATQSEPTPKESLPIRIVRAYVYYFTFPIRFLLCSAKPVEDETTGVEETPSSNATSEKSPMASSSTAQPTGEKTAKEAETSEKAIGGEPEPTIHLSRAVPVTAF
jgi:hypothetical protein